MTTHSGVISDQSDQTIGLRTHRSLITHPRTNTTAHLGPDLEEELENANTQEP